MALTTLRENSLLTRSTAFVSWLKKVDGSTAPVGSPEMALLASYSSRTDSDGLVRNTVSFATSRNSMLAVTVMVYRDACCSAEMLVGMMETFVTAPTSTASAPVDSGTIL